MPAEDGASSDAVPIPDSWTLCGLPGASLETLRFALLPPVVDGEKATPTVQELLGATAWPSQVLEAETIEKSAASAPATVTVLTFIATAPSLRIVAVFVAVVPTRWPAN